MAHTLQLDHQIKANIPTVYPSVLDMRHFGKHHPYMKEVTVVQTTPDFTEYNVKEFIWLFGFIPQWPNYNAKVFEKEKHKHIQYTSDVKGGVFLTIDFRFSNNTGDSTLITENIHLTGNKMVSGILLNAISKAHPILFKSLEAGLGPVK